MPDKCLYCYEPLNENETDFHKKCSKKMFSTETPPLFDFNYSDIEKIAKKTLSKSLAITGVQPKLSLDLQKAKGEPSRFTIVGLFGNYILKPPFAEYPEMPELEDLTMGLAELAGIKTASHSLIRLRSGELAYINKRFDRVNEEKLHLEDFAQLLGVLTERKYKASVEKIGKTIQKHSSYPGNDVIKFFEIILFSFLTGNTDMHLKNYSLLRDQNDDIVLSPAYDLLSTKLLIPEDQEESALTINGKKAKLQKTDFNQLAEYLDINKKTINSTYKKFIAAFDNWKTHIEKSFLSEKMQKDFIELIEKKMEKISD